MKGIGDRRKDSELVILYVHLQRAALARILDPSLTAPRHQLVAKPLAGYFGKEIGDRGSGEQRILPAANSPRVCIIVS